MNRPLCWTVIAAVAALPSCATQFHPVVLSAAPTEIVYRVPPDKIEAARVAANAHCSNHQRRARFDRVTDSGGPTILVSFSCR